MQALKKSTLEKQVYFNPGFTSFFEEPIHFELRLAVFNFLPMYSFINLFLVLVLEL